MKFLGVVSLCLLLACVVPAQKPIVPLTESENKPVLKLKHTITVGGLDEVIVTKRFLDDEDRLLTVTNFGAQLWNTKTGERLRSVTHEAVNVVKFDSIITISPDGTRMVLTDGFNLSLSKLWGKKPKVSAEVFDLTTGKEIAVLQRPEKPVRRAVWTADGKTLVTFSNAFGQSYNMEIAFWDGETFEYRGSIHANDWNYLTRDGEKFITTSGVSKNTFGVKFEKPNAVNVWNTRTQKIERSFVLEKEKSLKNIRITADEKFLLSENDKYIIYLNLETGERRYFSAKDNSSVDSAQLSADQRFLAAENNGKILVWEIGAGSSPKFEITPIAPVEKEKRTTDILGFNFDGKHLAIWQMKYKSAVFFKVPVLDKTEFYELETGKLNAGMDFFVNRRTGIISADNKYAITNSCEKATVSSLETMKRLFIVPLRCKTGVREEYDASTGETKRETYLYNDDIITFHPQKAFSLFVKDDVLEIYGTDPEQKRLQIIDAPKMLKKSGAQSFTSSSPEYIFDNVANKLESYNLDPNYAHAGFLKGGNVVFAMSADARSIFFWDVDKNLLE
jgi:WD40 repeat protein